MGVDKMQVGKVGVGVDKWEVDEVGSLILTMTNQIQFQGIFP